jgi:hypothetical protein
VEYDRQDEGLESQVPASGGVVKKIRGLRWRVSTCQGEERGNGRSCVYAFLSKYLVLCFEMGHGKEDDKRGLGQRALRKVGPPGRQSWSLPSYDVSYFGLGEDDT